MAGDIRLSSARGKWILAATVGGSAIALLDSTVVNVALPHIGKEFDATIAGLQWIVNGYLLTLASLILVAGSLSDLYGRRRIFLTGVVWFASSSLLCGLAPTLPFLVAARILQGVGGALLTPGSLALIEASFHPDDRGRAIGAWSGFGGIAAAAGPLMGGYLTTHFSWRWIFLINLPLACAVVFIAVKFVPESRDEESVRKIDVWGAVLGVVWLAALTFVLIEGPERGFNSATIVVLSLVAIAAFVSFLVVEKNSVQPLMPLRLFSSRQFSSINLMTVAIYAALSGMLFLLSVFLQNVLLYSPILAGLALLPITILMLTLAAKGGALAARIGPRLPLTLGPALCGCGFFILSFLNINSTYIPTILLGVVVFGFGLVLTVAPLTVTVLAAAPDRYAGIASGINNAIARAGGLVGVAVLPALGGITGDIYDNRLELSQHFGSSAMWAAILLWVAALLGFLLIRNEQKAPA